MNNVAEQSDVRNSAQRFLEIMNRWLCDPHFQRLCRYEKTRHWMDYQTFHESNYRDFLIWILSPREGHGLGDFFVKRLLLSLNGGYRERMEAWITSDSWPSPSQLEQMSFTSLLVARELRTKSAAKSPRIDLLLLDPKNKLLVMIERKDGSQVSETQLVEYEDWANNTYPDFQQIWLISDSCRNIHKNSNENWLQIDDEWLVGSLTEVIETNQLPTHIQQQFEDFICLLQGKGLWTADDNYYIGIDGEFSDFAAKFTNDIRAFRSLRVLPDSTTLFLELNERMAIERVIPAILSTNLDESDKSEIQASVELSIKYHHVLVRLAAENRLEKLRHEIDTKFPEKLITNIWRDRNGGDHLSISLKRFEPLETLPLEVSIHCPAVDDSDSDAEKNECRINTWFKVTPALDGTADDEAWGKVVEKFRNKSVGNQKWTTFGPRTNSVLPNMDQVKPEVDRLLEIEAILVGEKNS